MAQSYEVTTTRDENLKTDVYLLRDLTTGAEARIAPAFGNNLYSFTVPIRGAALEAMIDPGPNPAPGVRFGNPILYPFPNRVRAGRFSFGGKSYQLDANNPTGNAIHGLVARLPWRVEGAGVSDDGAAMTAYLASEEHPNITRQFPFPFRIAITHTLKGDTVRLDTVAENVGQSPMPMGFGIHAYFRLPLSPAGRREDCLVKVPSSRQWETEPSLLPTGRVIDVPAEKDFHEIRPLGSVLLDDIYTDVQKEGGVSECLLRDPAAGAELSVRADGEFREIVAYAPPTRPTICFEPYTCTTDAFNLQPQGIDAGLIVLEPGKAWRGTIWFTLRPA